MCLRDNYLLKENNSLKRLNPDCPVFVKKVQLLDFGVVPFREGGEVDFSGLHELGHFSGYHFF